MLYYKKLKLLLFYPNQINNFLYYLLKIDSEDMNNDFEDMKRTSKQFELKFKAKTKKLKAVKTEKKKKKSTKRISIKI